MHNLGQEIIHFIFTFINSVLSWWKTFNGGPFYVCKCNRRESQMSAFKYEQFLLKQILDAFPFKVLFMIRASRPRTAVRSHTERMKEKKEMLLSWLPPPPLWLPMHVTALHHPGIDLWAPILQGSPQGGRIDLTLLSALLGLNYASRRATRNL